MNESITRLLFVTDTENSSAQAEEILLVSQHDGYAIETIRGIAALAATINGGYCDAVIMYTQCSADQCFETVFKALQRVMEQAPGIPLIAIAEEADALCAAKCMQSGAQDFFIRSMYSKELFLHALRGAVERESIVAELRFALASEKVLMEELDKKNKELVELSITDGLTGLYNHRFIQERFDFEFKRAKRYGSALACMLIDIDHFKQVNDTYGHQFGDFVLSEIAMILQTRSRDVDICGRYGGEEFMVITSLSADEMMKYATKLHTSIDKYNFDNGEHSIHVTVSIGVADYSTGVRTKQELIERSDTAMYWAKRDGRNIIRLWKEIEGIEDSTLDHYSIEGLREEFSRLSHEVRATYMESTNALVRAIDAKDHYTQEHSKNVAYYAVLVAEAQSLPAREVEIIKYAGLLHDVGKIGISQEILTKKDALTGEEFEALKKHPAIGANILKDVKFLEKEIPIILHHHEHYDGTGYPHSLKGREIPLGARILSVVDAYDAMTTDREYRKKMTQEEAIAELLRGSGSQFTPEIVELFVDILKKQPAGASGKQTGQK